MFGRMIGLAAFWVTCNSTLSADDGAGGDLLRDFFQRLDYSQPPLRLSQRSGRVSPLDQRWDRYDEKHIEELERRFDEGWLWDDSAPERRRHRLDPGGLRIYPFIYDRDRAPGSHYDNPRYFDRREPGFVDPDHYYDGGGAGEGEELDGGYYDPVYR